MTKNEMDGVCETHGCEKKCVQGLIGKSEGKGSLGRPRTGWEDNIKMGLEEI